MQPVKLHAACATVFLLLITACTTNNKSSQSKLGDISFAATGKPEAQPYFKKGMLYLHSFEYEDAAEEFQKAKQADPGFAMAYWGEAMTRNHTLWREQDYDKGVSILNELAGDAAGRVAKAQSEFEKDLITAVNILYGQGNKSDRDSTYAAFMHTLYKKYPGNDEIASLYSLSLIGWGLVGRQTPILEQAAEIAKEVLQRNPRHPGALHYLIHAFDDPGHAARALEAADKYAVVAPEAGHALHMPTHIYLSLGMWDKVISSNIESWNAEWARKKRKALNNNALGYHSWHWLQYGYLQKGNTEIARNMVDSMQKYCTELPSPLARAHMILLKSTYLAETNDYLSPVADIQFDNKDLNIMTRSREYFVDGMQAYYKKDAAALEKVITTMAGERLIEAAKVSDKGLRVCSNINRSMATKSDLEKTEIMELELRAMDALLENNNDEAENYFKKATHLENKTSFAYGPPQVVKPSFELYGEWLLKMNRRAEALEQFENALKLAPNRRNALGSKSLVVSSEF